jgi:hypothetical protein
MWLNPTGHIYASEQFSHFRASLHHKSYRLGVFSMQGSCLTSFSFRIEALYGATSESVEISVLMHVSN